MEGKKGTEEKMKEMRTFEDFVIRYWIVLLTVIAIIVLALFISEYGNAAIIAGFSYPWYLNHRDKETRKCKHTLSFHHPYIKKILSVIMFEFVFNRNRIISIDLLEENGITPGQVAYATSVLRKRGVVKKHNAKHLKLISFKKAKEMEKSEIFKGVTWT